MAASVYPTAGLPFAQYDCDQELRDQDDDDLRDQDELWVDELQDGLSLHGLLKIDDPKSTVHVKGFTSGMNHDELIQIAAVVADLIREREYQVICWDGDDWAEDSFTAILPILFAKLPELRFVAFLRAEEMGQRHKNLAGFQGSWKEFMGASKEENRNADGRYRFSVICANNCIGGNDTYEHLGFLAMRATMATTVVAIGGGNVLRKEHELHQLKGSEIDWVLFDATRLLLDGSKTTSSLRGLSGVVVRSPPYESSDANLTQSTRKKGVVQISTKIMQIVAIDERAQTFTVLLYIRMEWDLKDKDGKDKAPWLEWRNLVGWEYIGGDPNDGERTVGDRVYKTRHSNVKATFLQPFDVKDFPLDAHNLEMVLVTNELSDVDFGKMTNELDAASLAPWGTSLCDNSTWKLIRYDGEDAAVCHFDGTNASDSRTKRSYAQMTIKLCVMRRSEFALFNVILPNFLLTIFQIMSYAIELSAIGDRLALAATILLAMFAGKLAYVGVLPAVSYLTFLDWYMITSYIFVTASVSHTCILQLLVSMPPVDSIDGDGDAQDTSDQAGFYTFLGAWMLYHAGFLVAGIRKQKQNHHQKLEWLTKQLSTQNKTTCVTETLTVSDNRYELP